MIRTTRATPKSARRRPKDIAAAVQEKLDATPERLARAREAGETPIRDSERLRRILDPFDTMRANRLLAPHDQKLNDIRWLVGESLRRTHQRARLDTLRAVAPDRLGSTGFGPRPGLLRLSACETRRLMSICVELLELCCHVSGRIDPAAGWMVAHARDEVMIGIFGVRP
jgi:hypothetical protein